MVDFRGDGGREPGVKNEKVNGKAGEEKQETGEREEFAASRARGSNEAGGAGAARAQKSEDREEESGEADREADDEEGVIIEFGRIVVVEVLRVELLVALADGEGAELGVRLEVGGDFGDAVVVVTKFVTGEVVREGEDDIFTGEEQEGFVGASWSAEANKPVILRGERSGLVICFEKTVNPVSIGNVLALFGADGDENVFVPFYVGNAGEAAASGVGEAGFAALKISGTRESFVNGEAEGRERAFESGEHFAESWIL